MQLAPTNAVLPYSTLYPQKHDVPSKFRVAEVALNKLDYNFFETCGNVVYVPEVDMK